MNITPQKFRPANRIVHKRNSTMNPAMNLTQQFYNASLGQQNYQYGMEAQKQIYEQKQGNPRVKKNLNARTMRNTITDMKVNHTQEVNQDRSNLNGSNIESDQQDFGLFTPNNMSTMTPHNGDPHRQTRQVGGELMTTASGMDSQPNNMTPMGGELVEKASMISGPMNNSQE